MVPPCGGTNAGGTPLVLPHPKSSSETLDDGGDQSRLKVDEALARGRQTLQIKAISIERSDI